MITAAEDKPYLSEGSNQLMRGRNEKLPAHDFFTILVCQFAISESEQPVFEYARIGLNLGIR